MTDTLSTLFTVSLNNDDTDGNDEYTLLTTDADTSHVIKDLLLSSAVPYTLRLNGVDVGTYSEAMSGSKIVPVSSTLKAHFPQEIKFLDTFSPEYTDTSPYRTPTFVSQRLVNGVAYSSDETSSTEYPFLASFQNSTTNRLWRTATGEFFNTYDDGNSTTHAYYWASSVASQTSITTTSYASRAYDDDNETMYYMVNQGLYKYTGAGGAVLVDATFSPTGTMSSYPRMVYRNGYLFLVPNSTYTTSVYAHCIATGIKFTFDTMAASGSLSTAWRLAVAYDVAADKFNIYRINSSGTIHRATLTATKTSMDAEVSNQTVSSYASETSFTTENMTDFDYTSWSLCDTRGSKSDGNILTYSGATTPYNKLYAYDVDADTTELITTLEEYSHASSQWVSFDYYTPTPAQIAAITWTPPISLDLSCIGITTT